MTTALNYYRSRVSILKRGYQQERYRIDQICRSFIGRKRVRSISSVDIAAYRDLRLSTINPRTQKPLSASTVRLELSLLSNFFDIARIEWGLCNNNPVKNVRKPKPPPGRDRRLTPREERLILRYCHSHSNPELYVIITLALETAMRQGEILSLRWEHINIKGRIAHLPETKNGTKRDVPLSLKARDTLIRLGVKQNGSVFGYTANGIKSTWRYMVVKLKIKDLHFHDLRHESISKLFELGTLDMMEIAAISGHKSLAMLKRYTHLKAQRLVRKLEGSKNKGKQAIFNHLVPYPAELRARDQGFNIRVLDFEDLVFSSGNREAAIEMARVGLLRRILSMMRSTKTIPAPDQYLEFVPEEMIIMLDPLEERLNTKF